MSDSQMRLPMEILALVINVINTGEKKDLLPLALASTSIRYEVERVLYREVGLQSNRRGFTGALVLISHCERIAHRVESLDITFSFGHTDDQHHRSQITLLQRALAVVKNLTSLFITVARNESKHLKVIEGISLSPPPFSLRTLFTNLDPGEPILKSFIVLHRQLNSLYLTQSNLPSMFSEGELPELTTLRLTQGDELSRFCPQLPVARLRADYLFYLTDCVAPDVKVLYTEHDLDQNPDALPEFASLFPNLRYLELECPEYVRCTPDVFGHPSLTASQEVISRFQIDLSQFSHLRCLKLHTGGEVSDIDRSGVMYDWHEWVFELFIQCESLQLVKIIGAPVSRGAQNLWELRWGREREEGSGLDCLLTEIHREDCDSEWTRWPLDFSTYV